MPPTSPRDPLGLLGQTLDGRYLLHDVLGVGDTGVVYRGEHLALQRACAIKILQPVLQRDAARLRRLIESSQRAARLGCDRLVVADDIVADSDRTAFVMPLLQGEDLGAHLRRLGALPWGQVRELTRQIGAALRDLHARGLASGGLKPSNIFLHQGGESGLDVRLLDVGISRHDPQTASAAYISPEQVHTGHFDARSDLYSFAVVIHELLTGQPVFVGTPAQVAQMHRFKPPRGLAAAGVVLPPAVDELLLAVLAKDPAARPDLATLLSVVGRTELATPTASPRVPDPPTLAGTAAPAGDAPTRNLSLRPSTPRAVPAPSFRASSPIDEESATQFLRVPPPATLSRSGELDDPDQLTRPLLRRELEERTQATPIFTPRTLPIEPPPGPPARAPGPPAPPVLAQPGPARAAPARPPATPPAHVPPILPGQRPPPPPAPNLEERTVLSPALHPPTPASARSAPVANELTIPSPAHFPPQSSPLPISPALSRSELTIPSPAHVSPPPPLHNVPARSELTVPSPALAPQPPPLLGAPSTAPAEPTVAHSTQRTEIIVYPPAQSREGARTAMIPGFGGAMLHDPGGAPPAPSPTTDLVVASPRPPSRLWARLRALLPARPADKPGFWARFRRAPADNRLPARRTPAWLDGFLRGLSNLPRRVGSVWRLAARPFASASALRSRFSTPLAALRSSLGKLWRMITRYTGGGAP